MTKQIAFFFVSLSKNGFFIFIMGFGFGFGFEAPVLYAYYGLVEVMALGCDMEKERFFDIGAQIIALAIYMWGLDIVELGMLTVKLNDRSPKAVKCSRRRYA